MKRFAKRKLNKPKYNTMPYNKVLISLLIIFGYHSNAISQKTLLAEGRAEVVVGNDRSVDEYIDRCIETARINAVATVNGLIVLSEMSDITTVLNGKSQANVFTQVNEVRTAGYWLKDFCKPVVIKEITPDGTGVVSCSVKGYVKQQNPAKELIVNVMDCPDLKCGQFVFYSGQRLFVNVASASDGFISVWLEDVAEKRVYLLTEGRKIFRGQSAVLFGKGENEVLLTSDAGSEKGLHRLFVVRTKAQENYFPLTNESSVWDGGLKNIIPGYIDYDKFITEVIQKNILCEDVEMKSVTINVVK